MARLLRVKSHHISLMCNYSSTQECKSSYDAIVIGGGHNGLVAAAYLQKAGFETCVLEKRHVIGGAAVTEEIVPGFKFSRASYVLSLLRPHIYKDLELQKHGLKVYTRNPSSYTPIIETRWRQGEPRSLTLGLDEKSNLEQIANFSQKDAQNTRPMQPAAINPSVALYQSGPSGVQPQSYKRYEELLQRLVTGIEPLLDLSVADLMGLLTSESTWTKILYLYRNPNLIEAARCLGALGKDIPALYEFFTSPTTRILARWFESEPLQATLATDAVIGTMAGPDTPGSGYTLLHHCMGEVNGVRGGWGYPEGGMGAVTQAIAAAASSYGAHIFTNMEISEIDVNSDQRAVGVVTTEGKEIKGRIILSNATPQVTFQNLLQQQILPEEFRKAVADIDYTSPVTKINVAVNKLPDFKADPCVKINQPMPHHQCTIHINCENTDYITKAYQCALDGRISDRPMIEMVIPSSVDTTLAPPGCHVCLLFTQYTPYHLKNGGIWDEKQKAEYAKTVFSNVEDYAPGFIDSIVGMEVLSPPDLEHIFGLTGGNIFHGALSLDQLFLSRPIPGINNIHPPYTPVENLLLCGSGAHPGGGVMGAPGHIAARTAIATLSSTRK